MGRKLTEKQRKIRNFKVSERRRKLKEMAVAYKGGKCEICGYNKCLGAMDFHHLDPDKKDFSISRAGHIRSWAITKIEIDKCILLCRNCHSETHYAEHVNERLKKIDLLEIKLDKKNGQTNTNCAQCNLPMRVFNSRLKRSKSVFCGLDCKRLYYSKYVWPTDEELLAKVNLLGTKELIKQLNLPKNLVYKKISKIRSINNDYTRPYMRKVEHPSKELLNELLWSMPTTKIAKQYNVSDKAVEKWAKKYGLEKPSRGYWSKQK